MSKKEGGIIFYHSNLSGATKKIYDYLFDEIVSNRLVPGSAISELEISKKLQTSRSPVREAMMVLESEGMVRRYPGRGCFVEEVTVQDINEIFGLRTLLETEALRKSFDLLAPQELDALEQELTALTPDSPADAYYETDRHLHELIVNNCGNVRLMLILRTLNGQIEQFRRVASRQPKRLRASRQEHLDIVAALQAHDLEQGCSLLTEHIKNVKAATLSVCLLVGLKETRRNRQT
nr:GntR family transcriptional regulator [uncultured Oscillibacter sp.]